MSRGGPEGGGAADAPPSGSHVGLNPGLRHQAPLAVAGSSAGGHTPENGGVRGGPLLWGTA